MVGGGVAHNMGRAGVQPARWLWEGRHSSVQSRAGAQVWGALCWLLRIQILPSWFPASLPTTVQLYQRWRCRTTALPT